MAQQFASVDDYVHSFPAEVQSVLAEIRSRIHRNVPNAGEKISYQIPTIVLDGQSLVHFAGWKHHVSLYPVPEGDEAYQQEIEPHRAGEGTLKFLLRKPIPYELIERTVRLLLEERIQPF